jgi:hypothetical protein
MTSAPFDVPGQVLCIQFPRGSERWPDVPSRLVAIAVVLVFTATARLEAGDPLISSIDVTHVAVADTDTYWMHARPAIVPVGTDGPGGVRALITLQRTDRVGTHMFHGIAEMWSNDLGKSWTDPTEPEQLARVPRANGIIETPCDLTPKWHDKSRRLLATGATFWIDPKLKRDVPEGRSDTAYAVYDPRGRRWGRWKTLTMPDREKFHFSRAGCTQRVDLSDGDILLPIYFVSKGSNQAFVTVVRCRFDGETLSYVQHGDELTVDSKPGYRGTGLHEPSLTCFNGTYFLTIRGVEHGYVASGRDGLHYSKPKRWTFNDGKVLGSVNTQQHWVTHSDGLFLTYTRVGADNANIFRGRAPVFIGRVDPEKLQIDRTTEREVLPNLGDALGNFGVCNATPRETWVSAGLRNAPPGKPSVFLARIRWSKNNNLCGAPQTFRGDASAVR